MPFGKPLKNEQLPAFTPISSRWHHCDIYTPVWPRYTENMGGTDETTCSSRRTRGQPSKLVAIIDDDESMQDSLCDLVQSAGFVARCFGSAEEFLEYDLHREVGCLIAEIQMSGMSGLELQARLKEEQCNIPIIFITSNGGARMRIQAMRAGAVEFLAKPLDHQLLVKTVRAALDL
jgi:CheY-like chemotaxis protein